MITFTSKAYENISYFNEVALSLLSLMGHSGIVPGALKANEVAQALSNLQKGLGVTSEPDSQLNDEEEPAISLRKRALPLRNMLQAAVKENCDVLWS